LSPRILGHVTRRDLVHRIQDASVALVLCGVAIAELWVPLQSLQGGGSKPLGTALAVLMCGALLFRRIAPLATLGAMVGLWVLVYSITPVPVLFWGQFVPFLIAVYSVARHGKGWRNIAGAGVAAALLVFFDLRVDVLQYPEEIIFHWAVTAVVWASGRGLSMLEKRAADAATRASEVEAESRMQALQAVADERARIARELHDIVAHSVSVMVVQAGAAEQAADDEAVVRRALQTIRTTGTAALADMRRVVAMVRAPEDDRPLEPQPGMAELPRLIEQARAAGLDANLIVEGDQFDLPEGIDLAVYRIVQEALTNTRRHASARTALVTVRFAADDVEVLVTDDGTGASGDQPAGHGLIGMRERAALYGGRLDATSRPGGGFVVHAVLPVGVLQ
jgi:signal transduction histidine kinase